MLTSFLRSGIFNLYSKQDYRMLVSALIVMEIIVTVEAWPCVSPIRKMYSRVNSDAALQFSADLTNLNSPRIFDIKFHDNSIKARITYNTDKSSTTDALSGFSITGNNAGNVVVTLTNVQQNNAGVYTCSATGFSTKCNCLYILGAPRKPTVTVNKAPSVGESVTLTCSSTSTTTPSNHSLSLTYSWRVDTTDNPGGAKYTYTSSKDKLTVKNIVKEDVNKQFTCTATEVATGGYTSSRSDTLSLDVYYGPDNVAFSPSETSHEKDENESLNQVTCTATCHPTCSFTWTKTETGTLVSSSALLNLGRLQSSDAGTYRCTATRTGGALQSKDLTVNVVYGPRNIFFHPNDVSYRHDENYNLAPITCGADCWECSYSWSGPNSLSVSGAVLDLSPLTKSMAGTYTCTARNVKLSQQPLQTKQLLIEVRFGPDLIKVTNGKSVYTVDEGTILPDVKCEADCFPVCIYKWTKDGHNIVNTDTLSLGQVQKSSAGNYTCRATNGDMQSRWKEKRVTIYIRYGPYQSSTTLSPSAQNYTKNEGQSLNDIICSGDCYPDCTYTWRKTIQTTTVSSTNVLSIGKLHREDAAIYTCIAKNPEKSSSSTTTIQTIVNVRYGPDSAVLSKTSPHIITEGDTNEKIECLSECYPGCSYKWTNRSSAITSERVLQLNTVLRENACDYKCISTNTATSQFPKSAEATIKIIVQYAPDVNISLSTTSVKEGESLSLYCNGHGVPSSYIYTSLFQSWNNVAIPNNNTVVDHTEKYSSLYFKSLRLDDTGTYTCTLNNGISNLSGILDQSGTREIIVQDYFTLQLNTEGGLSPGVYTVKHAEKFEHARKHAREVINLPSTKRIILKQERFVNQMTEESLEGDSYIRL
ncbi:hemicentin-1-like, partial [Ruditapes philippinarum]|uniref:hemicentin-1-like n=1 Tax=Ruditapes philippinarum TaxID=129788 RepID=UPI00295A6FC3